MCRAVPAHAMEVYRERRDVTPFLTSAIDGLLSASRTGSFTPGKEPLYPVHRSLGGPQSQRGRCWRRDNLFAPTRI